VRRQQALLKARSVAYTDPKAGGSSGTLFAAMLEKLGIADAIGKKAVLEHINLQIFEGEVTTIIGLSGSGKTVLLKHIIGMIKPDEILVQVAPRK